MRYIFFIKNCANTEPHSFADMYAIWILDEGNNHSSRYYFNWHYHLRNTNFPLPQVLKPDLEI